MITSRSNPIVKQVRALQGRRRERYRAGEFVIEGTRLAQEALSSGATVRLVLHTDHLDDRGRSLVNGLARSGAEVRVTSEQVMAECSRTESPPGLLVVVAMHEVPTPERLTLALVADGVRNPGNLGTLLRTALAAGVEAVFLTEGSVDPYNPKVVRGGMGAHFGLPIRLVSIEDLAQDLGGMQVWLAGAGVGMAYHEVDWKVPAALVIGSEASGPRRELEGLASGWVQVPMRRNVESLNVGVAAAVILFEAVRQRGSA